MSISNPNHLSMKDRLRQIPSLKGPLPHMDLERFPDTPHAAFTMWLEDALAAGIKEPHAMTLSMADESGWPDARVLILKNVDKRGWHFAIKAESPKGKQIEVMPKVALTFYRPDLGRQVRIRGEAAVLNAEECAKDFLERPSGSKVSAIASRQSDVLKDNRELEQRLSDARTFLAANPDHVALDWRVYAVSPVVVEFWQGASDRNHIRLQYALAGDGMTWEMHRLWS
jgi:pyridoxamine 5'-phosphate oxidase